LGTQSVEIKEILYLLRTKNLARPHKKTGEARPRVLRYKFGVEAVDSLLPFLLKTVITFSSFRNSVWRSIYTENFGSFFASLFISLEQHSKVHLHERLHAYSFLAITSFWNSIWWSIYTENFGSFFAWLFISLEQHSKVHLHEQLRAYLFAWIFIILEQHLTPQIWAHFFAWLFISLEQHSKVHLHERLRAYLLACHYIILEQHLKVHLHCKFGVIFCFSFLHLERAIDGPFKWATSCLFVCLNFHNFGTAIDTTNLGSFFAWLFNSLEQHSKVHLHEQLRAYLFDWIFIILEQHLTPQIWAHFCLTIHQFGTAFKGPFTWATLCLFVCLPLHHFGRAFEGPFTLQILGYFLL
jgi:hypothetical protein